MEKLISFTVKLFSHIVPGRFRDKYFKLVTSEGFMYLVFGVLTTVVSYVSYALSSRIFHFDYYVSTTVSWLCAVTFAFITNKLYVFKSRETEKKLVFLEALKFYASRLLSLGVEYAMMFLLTEPPVSINDFIAKIISNVLVLIINYVMSKLLIFKNGREKK